ncbi:Chemotaxis protein methyltransferase [compost metagenome]
MSVWCCAASTGEEPYSIAMTLVEALGPRAASSTVLATDIDTNVLNRARAAVYPAERVAKMEDERLRRFFLKGRGANADTGIFHS